MTSLSLSGPNYLFQCTIFIHLGFIFIILGSIYLFMWLDCKPFQYSPCMYPPLMASSDPGIRTRKKVTVTYLFTTAH